MSEAPPRTPAITRRRTQRIEELLEARRRIDEQLSRLGVLVTFTGPQPLTSAPKAEDNDWQDAAHELATLLPIARLRNVTREQAERLAVLEVASRPRRPVAAEPKRRTTLDLQEWTFLVRTGETPERAAQRCDVTFSAVEQAIARQQGGPGVADAARRALAEWRVAG